ncbi:MAG: sulfite exporter TauE/SafE family protein [Propionicimonas sp.]|uniref:sulfite exporter TauE/SafE family protein n=1 Tax=Propionicimonas sp. TaxID=1955623 RepID=UPI003D0EA430
MDVGIALAGLLVGIVVGLTGMGGGALMTPVLVFFFKVDALTAISSDVVSSLFMKPAGAIVHIVRKTANLQLAFWLCVGSVPSAFLGAMFVDHLKVLPGFEQVLLAMLGVALLLASSGLIIRAWFQMTRRSLPWGEGPAPMASAEVEVRKVATVALGALGGLMVGMTSVGAGSLILTLLLVLYPRLKPSQLVGTDLVQAVPLVAAASLGHLIFGQVSLGITGSMLIGAIPGTFIGAQISSRAPGGVIRRALAVLLMASGLKLLGVSTPVVLIASALAIVVGPIAWAVLRRRYSRARGAPPPAEDDPESIVEAVNDP